MARRLFLFSGMGGDSRLLAKLEVPGVAVVRPEHLAPRSAESLPEYARRVAEANGVASEDVVGGASFGGMVAAEIAKARGAAGLVLLGSCLEPRKLPASYRAVERLGRFIPDAWLAVRRWRFLVRWRFAPVSREAQDCLIAMARDCPPEQLREFGRMIVTWEGVSGLTCPVLSIHGDSDKVIPLRAARPGQVLRAAGHALTLTHAEQTSAALGVFLRGLEEGS